MIGRFVHLKVREFFKKNSEKQDRLLKKFCSENSATIVSGSQWCFNYDCNFGTRTWSLACGKNIFPVSTRVKKIIIFLIMGFI